MWGIWGRGGSPTVEKYPPVRPFGRRKARGKVMGMASGSFFGVFWS